MLNNIAFIGGIHGVGKSTICKQICDEIKLEYLSASELLKWKEINEDSHNKKVKSVPTTQDRLIVGLKNTIQKNKSYLLDGHYCLLNSQNEIVNVPIETFKQINPISLNLILGDAIEIKSRLEKRDNRPYDHDLLKRMQDNELKYAKYLSTTLGTTLNIGTQNDFSELLSSLHKAFLPK
jgi:adenylate kinase